MNKMSKGLGRLMSGISAVLMGLAAADFAYADRPNIVVIMTDDQDADSLDWMPNVYRHLAKRGTRFDNSFVATPQDSPSRATYLTGQFSRHHGVLSNEDPDGGFSRLDHSNTIAVWLQNGGYHTAHIGKYLDGYTDLNQDGRPDVAPLIPPGWAEWYALVDPHAYNYFGFRMHENGRSVLYPQDNFYYSTDLLALKAARYIQSRAGKPEPFFLSVAFIAPHAASAESSPRPAPRHTGIFNNVPMKKTLNFNEQDNSDKPSFLKDLPFLNEDGSESPPEIIRNFRRRYESLLAVDDAVKRIMEALASAGKLGNTVVIYTSDNGFLQGEHRIAEGKLFAYDPSIRVPLVIRGPGFLQEHTSAELVSNIDLAPTLAALAGVNPGRVTDGRSLVPLLLGQSLAWRNSLLIESLVPYGDKAHPGRLLSPYHGVRTDRYLYMEYQNGERELYDLLEDPFELKNEIGSLGNAEILANLREKLVSLKRGGEPSADSSLPYVIRANETEEQLNDSL